MSRTANRFDFDPRALEDRKAKTIKDIDLMGLQRASDGNAAILKFFPHNDCAIYQEAPDLSDAAVVREETVVSKEEKPMPLTLLDIASKCKSAEELMKAALVPLSCDDVTRISEATTQQRDNEVWFAARAGRITASILKKCIDKVDASNNVIGGTTSYVKQIMNYYPKAHSPAINWGVYNEAGAISDFLKSQRTFHKNMRVRDCGLYICAQYPYLGASPDAIVTCDCCGNRPLEVKNPFKYRHMPITEYAKQKDSCLEAHSDGTISLKYDHQYYSQVQLQMLSVGSDVGYFCVKTACRENNLFSQEVYMNPDFLEEAVVKAHLFFKEVVVPELLTGSVKKSMAMTATCDSEPVMSNYIGTTESVVDFPCGKCGAECLEEPKESKEMSIGCDCCDKWFHWQCANITGSECFILDNLTWFCNSCKQNT